MENEKKQSHISGLPVALIFFTLALVALIDAPAWFFGFAPIENRLNNMVIYYKVKVPVVVTPTVAPTATPSAALRFPVKSTVVTPKGVTPTK